MLTFHQQILCYFTGRFRYLLTTISHSALSSALGMRRGCAVDRLHLAFSGVDISDDNTSFTPQSNIARLVQTLYKSVSMLEVAAAIIGILAAAGKVAEILGPVVSSLRNQTKHAAGVLSEVKSSRNILEALQRYLNDLRTSPTTRKELISVDQLVTALTDGWLLFTELEGLLMRLDSLSSALPKRMQWAWNDKEFASFIARIRYFKISISIMLNILQW